MEKSAEKKRSQTPPQASNRHPGKVACPSEVTHISVWITSPYAEPEVVDIEMSFPLEMQTVYDVALDSLQSFDTTKLSRPVAVTPQLHHHFGSIMLLPDWVPLSEYYAMVIDARSIGKGLFSFYMSSRSPDMLSLRSSGMSPTRPTISTHSAASIRLQIWSSSHLFKQVLSKLCQEAL